ncbi:HugZ family protein [Methylocella sp.]|uniref:HugZ family protein n=1 Tax=Methylocella sp. TaxID=1978226 RepID=UPI0037851246
MTASEPDASKPSVDAAAFDAPGEAKRLLREGRSAALATLAADGAPFASLVNLALRPDGAPILLMSRLAAHTRHLERDGRLSLLIAEGGDGDPLAHPRLTLVGRADRADEAATRAALRGRFLARHPQSALYADFTDFSFWSVDVASAHLNGGFARAANFGRGALMTPLEGAEALVAAEQGALDHMNADHADALALYAQAFAGRCGDGWTATGIDPDGLDLTRGTEAARVVFARRVANPGELRVLLVEMVKTARDTLSA